MHHFLWTVRWVYGSWSTSTIRHLFHFVTIILVTVVPWSVAPAAMTCPASHLLLCHISHWDRPWWWTSFVSCLHRFRKEEVLERLHIITHSLQICLTENLWTLRVDSCKSISCWVGNACTCQQWVPDRWPWAVSQPLPPSSGSSPIITSLW